MPSAAAAPAIIASGFGGTELEDVEPREQTNTYRFEGEVLVLTEPDEEDMRYHRR